MVGWGDPDTAYRMETPEEDEEEYVEELNEDGSCKKCEYEQTTMENEYYMKVENSILLIYGCKKHINILASRYMQGGGK